MDAILHAILHAIMILNSSYILMRYPTFFLSRTYQEGILRRNHIRYRMDIVCNIAQFFAYNIRYRILYFDMIFYTIFYLTSLTSLTVPVHREASENFGMDQDNQRDLEDYNNQAQDDDEDSDDFGHKPFIIFAAWMATRLLPP